MFGSIKSFFGGSKPEDLSKLPLEEIKDKNKQRTKELLKDLPFKTSEDSRSQGLVGLSNLGNTCYMNAALQCLTKSKELSELLISQTWLNELNCVGLFGSQGNVLVEYYKLVYTMFHTKDGSRTSPKELKYRFGKTFKQFDNWYQHDSQEFLSYLLSCLHEDCNRNLQKPYEAVKDYDSAKQTEEEYFNYCKKLMLRREDSKITDLFSGITRMSIKCPNEGCKYEALKFEQFNMLTLPLYKRKNQVEAEEFHMMSNEGIYTLHKRTVCYSKGMSIKETLTKINNLEKSLEAYPYNFYRYNEKNKTLLRVTDTDQNLDYLQRNGDDLLLIIQDTSPALPPDESQENDIFLKFKVKDSRVTGFSKPLFTSKRTSVQSLYKYVFGMTKLIAEKEFQVASFETYFPEPVKAAEDKIKNEDNPEEVGSEKNNTAQTSSTKGTTAEVTKQPNSKHMFTLSIINSDGTRTLIEYLPNQTLDELGRGDSSLTLEISYRFKDLLDLKGLGMYQIERSTDKLELVESRKGHQSIYDCLEGFIEDETLDQYNAWNCPKCKTRVKAELATTLQETPQLLIIHLKRFKKEGFTRKISDVIDFPIKGLELEKFTSSSAKKGQSVYDLYAITNHYGDTGGGHYTAFAKELNMDKWYEFDDGSVTHVRSANNKKTYRVG